MKSKIFVFFCLIAFVPSFSFAISGPKMYPPPQGVNQTVQGIAASDEENGFVILRANDFHALRVTTAPSGNVIIQDSVDLPANGSNDRVRMPDREGYLHCTIQADSDNTGSIYVGGPQVTNESGAQQGIELRPYDALSNIATRGNLNDIYVATETAGNDVTYMCN